MFSLWQGVAGAKFLTPTSGAGDGPLFPTPAGLCSHVWV